MTSTFRVLYVLIVIEHHSRQLIHFNVTAHPTAQWTRQQLRMNLYGGWAVRVLKSPPRSPKANSICERVISRQPQRPPSAMEPI